jgi:hypothetical protein
MGICDKCGYRASVGDVYYKDSDSGVCLCEECYSGVDNELMELLGVDFQHSEAGYDDVDCENDDFDFN